MTASWRKRECYAVGVLVASNVTGVVLQQRISAGQPANQEGDTDRQKYVDCSMLSILEEVKVRPSLRNHAADANFLCRQKAHS